MSTTGAPPDRPRAFEAAARHLGFKHAATELSLTPTAISHQVRQWEDSPVSGYSCAVRGGWT